MITISRKTINALIWVLTIGAFLTCVELALRSRPDLIFWAENLIQRETASLATDSPDAKAAVVGVTEFYNLNYLVPVEEWVDAVCATLTDEGCKVFKTLYAPGLRQVIDKNHLQISCTARAIQIVEEINGRKIWLLEATLDHPLPGSPATSQVFVEVVKGPDGEWRMSHVLTKDETKRFVKPAP
jgi:hypothetical protein